VCELYPNRGGGGGRINSIRHVRQEGNGVLEKWPTCCKSGAAGKGMTVVLVALDKRGKGGKEEGEGDMDVRFEVT